MSLDVLMQTVFLYGNSLSVSTIGASLQAYPDLQVLPLDPSLPGAIRRLEDFRPAIVIFDRATALPDSFIPLWRALPHLLMIGVDPSSDEMLVLSGHMARALAARDLLLLILAASQPQGSNPKG